MAQSVIWNFRGLRQNSTASFEFAGNKGMITYNHDESTPVILASTLQEDSRSEAVQIPRSVLKKDPYYRQLEHFLGCIEGKEEPIVTAAEAMKAIQVAQAAIRSAEEGQPVTFSEGGR